jgi:hypothetical protein
MLQATVVMTALEKALKEGRKYLYQARKEAERAKKYNIASCIKFLEAARSAALGLEDEVDEILIEAGLVARYEWRRRSELSERLQNYLNRDRLRKILGPSLEGISACYQLAVKDEERFFDLRREQKKEAREALLGSLEQLTSFLKSLDNTMKWSKVHYVGPSGVDLKMLLDLEKSLDDFKPDVQDAETRKRQIRTFVEAAQEKRQRHGLKVAADTMRVIQELTVAFRLVTMPDAELGAKKKGRD